MAEKRGISFDQSGLGEILKQYALKVPPNQREYSWTQDEVKQLLNDFAKSINEGADHFVGTLVTIPRPNGVLEVVDGQQRLATTALLLAAIRDFLRDGPEDVLVESINNEFLTGINRRERARLPKLTLNLDDNELFGHIVTGEEGRPPVRGHDSHERLVAAFNEATATVRKIVAVVDAKSHGDFLEQWVSFIQHRALVVLLKVPDDSDAFKMFETLNGRGLPTSQADLIKNYVFGHADGRTDEVQSRWSYMRGALESLDEDEITISFLRHALIAQTGPTREADVYERVQTLAQSAQSTVAFMSALEGLANSYVATFSGDHERWSEYPLQARRGVEALNLFGIRPIRPLLLAIADKMEQHEAAKSIEFLVSLGVRLLIASSTRSGSVETPLSEAAREVYEQRLTTAAQLREALSRITPSDQGFTIAFETLRVSSAKLARYYLRSLEQTAKDEPEPYFIPQDDQTIITVEHVLPKKPEGNWPDFTDDDVRTHVTRLGNQALMRATDNSHAKSDGFASKRAVYESSAYVLTAQVGQMSDWTTDSINARQKSLAGLAARTWPVD